LLDPSGLASPKLRTHMPWSSIPPPQPGEEELVRRATKAKLYADEDVEDEVVQWLRGNGVNIKSAREMSGHRGKPDSWHAAYAFKNKRFLVTKNTKDFFVDTELPWHQLHGLICLEGDMGDVGRYAVALSHVVDWLVPYGGLYEKTKWIVSATGAMVKLRTWDGRLDTTRYRFESGQIYEWSDA
jgi:hypothetical protein